ncbi:APC family permease [Fusobacterium sp.]|uniref:APC family permease n=1 Tax=Fusobacterium sp. TaxID=68766 RepID=UPI00396C87A2
MKEEREYGLFTAISMIVGIVIGSGIFFKSDNILVYTNGSVIKGIILFCLAAVGIVFVSLTIATLATKTTKPGGIITYADEYIGRKTAGCFGWFQVFIYFPVLVGVVSWIVAVYICMLFGWKSTPKNLGVIGGAAFIVIFSINYFSAVLGGFFQNFSTILKVMLLGVLAVAGFIFGDPHVITQGSNEVTGSFGAVTPIAFSYDGWDRWVVSTSISNEIKNSRKNLSIALILGPLFVLVAYIFYFTGISVLLGPEEIMRLGDNHVNAAVTMIFGNRGAKIFSSNSFYAGYYLECD